MKASVITIEFVYDDPATGRLRTPTVPESRALAQMLTDVVRACGFAGHAEGRMAEVDMSDVEAMCPADKSLN